MKKKGIFVQHNDSLKKQMNLIVSKTNSSLIYRVLFIYVFLYLDINISSAQNLVPNSSFEEPVNFDTVFVNGWHKIQTSDTPDYFNLGKTKPVNSIFDEYIGGTSPRTGDGFVGIFCYRIHPGRNIQNVREFIETPLKNTLEADSIYQIELAICLDGESNIAVKNFGIYFSDVSKLYSREFRYLRIIPQIEFHTDFLDDTKNWIVLSSLYKASGFEHFIILGNFMPDRQTQVKDIYPEKIKGKRKKWGLTKKERSSYYYIDDVCIRKITVSNTPDSTEADSTLQPAEPAFDIQKIEVDSAIILRNVQFEFNKSDLLPQSFHEIDKLYDLMNENSGVRVKLEGHTDNIGDYDFNLALSLRRVEAVASYLISKGIDPGRIEVEGYSYSFPLMSNDTPEGRAVNRRVVFKVLQK